MEIAPTLDVESGLFDELALRPVREPQDAHTLDERRIFAAASLEARTCVADDDADPKVLLDDSAKKHPSIKAIL